MLFLQGIAMKYIFVAVNLLALHLSAFEYELLFENEQISVVKVKVQAHEEVGLHRSPHPHVVIALQGGTITRLEANGSETEVHFPTGVAVYREADPIDDLHRSVNRGAEPVELIKVILKEHGWNP